MKHLLCFSPFIMMNQIIKWDSPIVVVVVVVVVVVRNRGGGKKEEQQKKELDISQDFFDLEAIHRNKLELDLGW